MSDLIVHDLPATMTELEIFPLMDLHIGDSKTDIRLFRNFVKFIKEKPNRFITIQGDLMNNAIKTSVSNVYNEVMNPREQKKWLIFELREIKDRILCFVPGNHEERSTKDVDSHPIEDIAIALGKEKLYCHNGAFLKISFGKRTENHKKQAYIMACIHGFGGGAKPGSVANRIEDFLYSLEGVDIIIMGHVHKKLAGRPSRLTVDPYNNKITQKDMLWVVASAWQDYGGYAFRMMLRPSPKGMTKITLSGKEKKFNCEV